MPALQTYKYILILQPSLNLLLSITQCILIPVLLAADLISVLLGNILRLSGRVVVPVRIILDLVVGQFLVLLGVGPLVDVDDDGTSKT